MKRAHNTNVNIRMDSELKKQAEDLFFELGINMTVAMTMFLRQAVRIQGIPFAVSRLTNTETTATAKEVEQNPKV